MDPFKMYDVRGIFPYEVNSDFAFKLGRSVVEFLGAKKLVIGRDGRKSGKELHTALVEGIRSTGCTIVDVGLCSTPQFYFEIFSGTSDGGIMITASHNPKEFNGFKICGPNAKPIYAKNGFVKIKKLLNKIKVKKIRKGEIIKKDLFANYVKYFSNFYSKLNKPLKILFDCGNGMGINEVKALKKIYGRGIKDTILFPKIDGTFPNHECNPVKKKNTRKIVSEMRKGGYDLGFAFDGDADRVVCITSSGLKIPSDVLLAIIAKHYCDKGDKVGYEVRTGQGTVLELEKDFACRLYPSGHAIIKKHMIKDETVLAGEKSGHYFYQQFHYTESTLFTIMQIMEFYCKNDLEKTVKEIISKRYSLEELNYKVEEKDKALKAIEKKFIKYEHMKLDGLSVYSLRFFFNVRKSNTENLLRLNVEGSSKKLVDELVLKIEKIISRL